MAGKKEPIKTGGNGSS